MAVTEVEVMKFKDVPTYNRPEGLAKVTRMLNDYYRETAIIDEQAQEIIALDEEIGLLKRVKVVSGTVPGLVAQYGRERVQGGPDPCAKRVSDVEYEWLWIKRKIRELQRRALALDTDNRERRVKIKKTADALSLLSPLQRDVIEARHRAGKKILVLAMDMKYDPSSVGKAYVRALTYLAKRLL